jgi:hypothetical protein
MNIFVLDTNPYLAAEYQCDKHVVKMVLETGQMLSTIHRAHGSNDAKLYATTHRRHPCTLWAEASRSNYAWLFDHFCGLSNVYTARYQKVHKTFLSLFGVVDAPPDDLPDIGLTPFAQAMPDEYKDDDAVVAYRRYYAKAKADILEYRFSPRPSWLNEFTC